MGEKIQTNTINSQALPEIVVWSILWSVGIVLLKIALALLYEVSMSPQYLGGAGLSIFSYLILAFLFAGLIFSRSGFWIRLIGYLAAIGTFVFYMAAFHHEIVFRSLPNDGFLYYLKEVTHLKTSLHANFPTGLFLIEMVFGCMLIFGGKAFSVWVAAKVFVRYSGAPKRTLIIFLFAIFGVAIAINSPLSKTMSPELFRGSREPVSWLVQTSLLKTEYGTDAGKMHPREVRRFKDEIGHMDQFSGVHTKYPLWTPPARVGANIIQQ